MYLSVDSWLAMQIRSIHVKQTSFLIIVWWHLTKTNQVFRATESDCILFSQAASKALNIYSSCEFAWNIAYWYDDFFSGNNIYNLKAVSLESVL